jgi:hypothetical protein
MQEVIPNYGWVPFLYFQHVSIILLLYCYSNYKKVNEKLDKGIYSKIKNEQMNYLSKIIIPLIPIFIILYLDLTYSSFSMSNLGITSYISNEKINSLLKLVGGYCIIQVAAQDVGVKTGAVQADFVKLPMLQFFMYMGVAFSLTQNRSMAIIAALLYFQMRFFVSGGITKDVCFE